jgi:hypothetical protein
VLKGTVENCFLVSVPNRTAGYNCISDIHGGLYQHQYVIHEENFVNPIDPHIHTQFVECMWAKVKSKLKISDTSSSLFNSYLDEFVWRRYHAGHLFPSLVIQIT